MMKTLNAQCDLEQYLDRLDGSGSDDEWGAALELHSRLGNMLPSRLLGRYRQAKKWSIRSSCVYHSVRYARDSDAAVELALLAVRDKAKVVRYRACMLLACSQRMELLPRLRDMLMELPADTKSDLMASIDAIESQNVNYFVDRDHSGMITLVA
jgi:hypothetical protein